MYPKFLQLSFLLFAVFQNAFLSNIAPFLAPAEGIVHYVEGIMSVTLDLPCNVTPPTRDNLVVVLWYKNNEPDAIYTYDARNASLGVREHTSPNPSIQSRAVFHPEAPSRLSIQRASLSDAGNYECRVDFVRTPSRTTLLRVNVIDPPKKLSIKSMSGHRLAGQITSNVGDTLNLICEVFGGHPTPQVWWTLDQEEVDTIFEPITLEVTQNELILPKMSRESHMKTVTCFSSNSNMTRPISASLLILLNMPPSSVTLVGLPSVLHEGNAYRVWCQVFGSRPAPILIWTVQRNGTPPEVLHKQDLSVKNVSKAWIDMSVDWKDHRGSVNCSAYSPALPTHVVHNSTILNVQFAPRVFIRLGSMMGPDDVIREERDIYFQCDIKANPTPYKVTWYHNDQEVVHNQSPGVLVANNNLVLQKVNRKWSGSYRCSASNIINDSLSEYLNITVLYAPVCVKTQTSLYRAAPGEEISLPCKVLAYPTNVTFSWTFSSLHVQERILEGNAKKGFLKSILRYQPEKSKDYGTIKCWAANSIGQQKKPCVFRIKAAGVPSPPLNCTVSNQTWESLEVTCEKDVIPTELQSQTQSNSFPEDEELELLVEADTPKYLWIIKERTSRKIVRNITGDVGTFSIKGLTPGLDYVIIVSRVNSHGKSPEVTLEAFTLRMAENRMRENGSETHSALLGSLIGAISVFVLIAALAFALAHRIRKRNSLRRDSLSTPSETTRLPLSREPGSGEDEDDPLKGGALMRPDLLKEGRGLPVESARNSGGSEETTKSGLSGRSELHPSIYSPTHAFSPSHLSYEESNHPSGRVVLTSLSSGINSGKATAPGLNTGKIQNPQYYVRVEGRYSVDRESFL